MVASLIGADWTGLCIGERVAGVAVMNIFFCINHYLCKSLYVLCRHIDNMQRKPLGRFASYAGKLGKLLNQFIDVFAV